ncbi:MAG: phenylalanine--tRNA ligase subunit beta [Planctomycetia bacterium]
MIISTTWLADYVSLPESVDALVERLMLSGLNHESTRTVGADTAVEIEVTSNRPDCLGHVGVAREAAVLFSRPLHLPDPRPPEGGAAATTEIAVEILAPEICPSYTARVIKGVRVGPSPAWLVERLATVGVASINNVVDVTNYVMLECGQPLHAFDLAKVRGGRISVRRAAAGESFTAINHKTYPLTDAMGVIADAEGAVALAGVMGGARTEIDAGTTDVLLESAQFAPLTVRAAARGLVLASGSSYRFERVPDPAAVDWASRRAAALILELAGGQLMRGATEAGRLAASPATIDLRHARVAEVLGIEIPVARQQAILVGLGFVAEAIDRDHSRWKAPTWRRDCWREIDLVEEIARIEGYASVPEDVAVPARPVAESGRDRTLRRAADVLVAAGFCEAMTRSVVAAPLEATASPWGDTPPLVCAPPLVRGADRLRRTLLPSLLEARAANVAVGAQRPELFETARGYLARPAAATQAAGSPVEEPLLLAFVLGREFAAAKGLTEAVFGRFGLAAGGTGAISVRYRPVEGLDLFAAGRVAEIVLDRPGMPTERVGVVGEVAARVLGGMGLKGPVSAAELRLDRLEFAVDVEPARFRPSEFPAVERDVNLVVDQAVPWGDIEAAIRAAAGGLLEECRLAQVWTDAERLGAGRKSFVVALRLRSDSGTLSGEEAGRTIDAVVAACGRQCGAVLRA